MSDPGQLQPIGRPFKLGFFTQVPGTPGQSDADVHAQLIETIVAAEELGYESVWVGQHHFGLGNGHVSSPLVLLAAVAARTSRIELGTAITTLPLENPIRLAEDAATLHLLSGGRLNLGLGGAGGDVKSFVAFGVDPEERHQAFDQKLAVLHALLEGRSLTDEGDPRRLGPVSPGLRDRLWHSPGKPDRAAAAARAGNGLLIGSFSDHPANQKAKIDAYLDEWARTQPPERKPRIGALRFTYVGESRESIERQVRDTLDAYRPRIQQLNPELAALDTHAYLRRVARYGTVQDVISDLLADPALLGYVDYFLPNMGLFPSVGSGTAGADLEIRRLELFATKIAPALGWRPADHSLRLEQEREALA